MKENNMLTILENYGELDRLKGVVSNRALNRAKYKANPLTFPVLYDLETGHMKSVNINYTVQSYNLIFRED